MLKPGEMISHYRIVSALGAGGMGEVFLATDTKLDRKVALKVLNKEASSDEERIKRFIREAKAASALNHPNILTVYEIGSFEGADFISTEYIEGETLRERIRREAMGLSEALKIITQVTAALAAAHDAGIVHRDVKPENIMLRGDGVVKVLDFGLAKLSPLALESIETTLPQINTKSGTIVGTIAYMSPEQARGRTIDHRSDIFSLGIVMFELFAGKRPFDGENQLELISSILKDEPPHLRDVAPEMPQELDRIVSKSLRKDREHRYQHIKDLYIDLSDLEEDVKFESKLNKGIQPTLATAVHLTDQSTRRSTFTTGISKTRRFTLLHAILFFLVLVSFVGVYWYVRPGNAPATINYRLREVASWASMPGELFGTASFSPDGKMIAFASTRSGTKGIWVTQTNSTEAISVTNDSFENTNPIWSAGGDELAYLSRRPGPDGVVQTAIWRISALGGGTSRMVAPVGDGSAELRRWGKSGRIYFDLRGELYTLDVISGSSQRITALADKRSKWVGISEDEQTIAYGTWENDRWQMHSADVAATNSIELGSGLGRVLKPIAFASGKLFFSAAGDSTTQVISVGVNARGVEQISSSEIENSVVDASPDGRSLLLSGTKEESNLWRVELSDLREYPVFRDLDAKLWPSISSDGQRVAFQSIKGLSGGNKLMSGAIVVRSVKAASDSERPLPITSQGFLPSWSPDGSKIAFLRRGDQQTELFIVSATGGVERRLTSFGNIGEGYSVSPYNLTQTRAFSWSNDGMRIVYIAERNGIANVWSVSISDGSEVQVTSNADESLSLSCPIFSPDGKKIAYSVQRKGRDSSGRAIRGIRWFDTVSGEAGALDESTRIVRLIGWTSDGTSLVLAEADKDNSGLPPETRLIKISLSGSSETVVASLKNIYFYNIFLSTDQKQLAYAARNQNLDDLWVMPVSGGQPRKLTRNNDTGEYISRLAWMPDGSGLVYGKQTRFSILSIMTNFE